jgi:predicted dehydrogenase
MRVGIIGCGSIGTRHAQNLYSYTDCEISLYDTDSDRVAALHGKIEGCIINTMRARVMSWSGEEFDQLLTGSFPCDAVIICTPHSTHVDYALKAIHAGKHVLVEKPLDTSMARISELESALGKKYVNFQVAYNLRHHPVVTQAQFQIRHVGRILSARFEYGSFLPNWRPGTDHKTNYAAHPDDGGIIMDDIHELDLVCFLVGREFSQLSCVASNIGDLGLSREDTADISVVVKHGCLESVYEVPVSVHMDYLQRTPIRKFRIVGTEGTLEGDLNSPSLVLNTNSFTTQFKFDKFDTNSMYVSELKAFLQDCKSLYVCNGLTGLKHALDSLKMAVAARESAENGITVRNS